MNSAIKVVACIIEREGKFLITQRLKHSHMGHLWEFPGGKVEEGESLEKCAVRECLEEIGVVVRPHEVIQDIEHDYPQLSVHLFFILCELVSGEPKAIQCADFRWASPEEFSKYEFPEADKKIIEEYIHGR